MVLRPMTLVAFLLLAASAASYPAEESPLAILREADRLSDLFNWADAGPLYARAEKLFVAAGDERNVLYARFGRMRAEMETLNLPETSDYLGAQLQSPLVQNDLRLKLMCLIVKGDVDGEIDSGPASADWQEAISVAKQLGNSKWESRASAELGFQQFMQGDIGAAMRAVSTALMTAHNTGDVGGEIRYLAAIGTALALRQLNSDAISYLDKAIGLARKHPDTGYPFVPIAGKIQALINQSNYKDALALIDESEREARSRHKEIKLAQVLLFKADIELTKREQIVAIATLNEVVGLTRKGHSRLFADAEMELADVYRERHDFQRAKEAAIIAITATGGSRDMYLAPGRLATLAKIEAALGNWSEAVNLYQRAIDIIEGMMSTAPDPPARAALLVEMSPIYSDYFSIEAAQNNVVQAFHVIEQVRGRIITESLLLPKLNQASDPQIEDRIRRLKTELVKAESPKRRRRLVDELFFAEQARWTKISSITDARVFNPGMEATLAGVQHELRAHEVVLEYVLGDSDSFCLMIGRSRAQLVRLPARRRIELLVERYLGAMKAKNESPADSLSLFAATIGPLRLSPAETSLLIVPDGILHLVPFSALRDDSGKYLISTRTLWYLPSAGILPLLRRARSPEPPKMLFAVGAVEYGKTPTAASTFAQVRPGLTRGDYYGVDVNKLPDLPSTGEEINSAVKILGDSDPMLKVGVDGTETEFKAAPLDQFRIIHLAIHGRANPKSPDRAALIFRPDPPKDDGLLEPREILGLHLNADLVTLSACETAVGHLQGEEGIANIARTFLAVGAKSVVSTLWKIDDAYSLYLMKRFYTHLREGMPGAAALASSQNDLLEKFGSDTPANYWAAFTLLGDGDGVVFPTGQLNARSR